MTTSSPRRKVSRLRTTLLAAGVVMALVGVTAPLATADDLKDQRDSLSNKIAEQAAAVDQASQEVSAAIAARDAAERELAAAQAKLKKAEDRLEEAEELDRQRARELEAAEEALKQARAEVVAAEKALDELNDRIDGEIMVITQQNAPLLNLALLLSDVTASELNQRAQLGQTIFDSSALELDELERLRFQLQEAELKAEAAEEKAAKAREAAAKQLKKADEARDEAAWLRDEVATLLEHREAAEARAKQQLDLEEQRQVALETERGDVERRIKAQIEKQRKEDEAREASERAERERSSTSRSKISSSSGSSGRSSGSSTSDAGFVRPVSGRITSKYGMRVHPVTGVYKLHDGTDFGASCGTKIKAAADGTVSDRYYHSAYGNRLMISHGRVDGSYVTTGYNHATKYIVGVGDTVSQGQTIGYVGSTGYSTGCHLHLMVWEDGDLVNPMSNWFD
ncbi:M23 family metallopeptidase [Tessaracoccus caeni]|uniref:M23 family metallopeptidase n=1 Tax=Tessaracoccus caeni TaxID=3031239 RepID=UPI0023DC05B5|nr:M23 family metallopeptidase [Tessaracoccus caeni]MDF1488406.1 peptidoglycan DD-metalloendopeptidase family protein [Tessaracoccus caeni]